MRELIERLETLVEVASDLSKDETMAIAIVATLKTSARKAEFKRAGFGEYGADHPLVRALEKKGLVKVDSGKATKARSYDKSATVTATRKAKAMRHQPV